MASKIALENVYLNTQIKETRWEFASIIIQRNRLQVNGSLNFKECVHINSINNMINVVNGLTKSRTKTTCKI